jgi:CTP:phosphocholine cytidylyltransferase-like protein
MKNREKERKNGLCYSLLELRLHYNDTYVLYTDKYNGPNIWANIIDEHPRGSVMNIIGRVSWECP